MPVILAPQQMRASGTPPGIAAASSESCLKAVVRLQRSRGRAVPEKSKNNHHAIMSENPRSSSRSLGDRREDQSTD